MGEILQQGRKNTGKTRNFLLQAISSFPKVFSKELYCRHIKTTAPNVGVNARLGEA